MVTIGLAIYIISAIGAILYIRYDSEYDEIKWLPIEEIPNYNWAFNHKSTLLNEIIPKLEEYYHNYVLDTIKVTYE